VSNFPDESITICTAGFLELLDLLEQEKVLTKNDTMIKVDKSLKFMRVDFSKIRSFKDKTNYRHLVVAHPGATMQNYIK